MYYSKVQGQLGKKKVNNYIAIPTIDEVDVIKYETEEGRTQYKLSVVEFGDRFIFEDNIQEEVFTEYLLDGNYEREKLESYMELDEMVKYDYARNKNMRNDCNYILAKTLNKLNTEALDKGRAYTLR